MPVRKAGTKCEIHISLAGIHQRAILDGHSGLAGLQSQLQASPLSTLHQQVSAVYLSTDVRIIHATFEDRLRIGGTGEVYGSWRRSFYRCLRTRILECRRQRIEFSEVRRTRLHCHIELLAGGAINVHASLWGADKGVGRSRKT